MKRDGYQITYLLVGADGGMYPGRIDVAALPVKDSWRIHETYEKRRERSLKMALYMLREALNGTWFLQQLSPGYAPLMPWLVAGKGKTISELWAESNVMSNLLPAPSDDFVEGEYKEG